jgi:hypothetical protein
VRSTHHAVLSGLASAIVVWHLDPAAPLVLVASGTVAGVVIDLDHFPIARYHAGDWLALRRVLAAPQLVVTDPDRIFEGARLDPLDRLLTHVLLGGLACPVAWLGWPALGVVLAASLYVHLVADLVHDVRTR